MRLSIKEVPLLISKLKHYESLLEDLSAENTRLFLENTSLKRARNATNEKYQLLKLLDEFKTANRRLINDNEDIKHRYDVSEKLRMDAKE